MRPIRIAALSAVAVIVLAQALPAAAQTRRAGPAQPIPPGQAESITVIDQSGRRTTRITVRPRSYLDPGTATRDAFQYHYMDYAVVPNYSVYYDRNDWKGSWSRMPLPGPFDVPGGGWNSGF
jgi:hypothetical protein